MTDSTGERIARIEEQVKTLFLSNKEIKEGVDKILDQIQNGRVHRVRLDAHDLEFKQIEELKQKRHAFCDQKFDELTRFKSRMLGVLIFISGASGLIFALIEFFKH